MQKVEAGNHTLSKESIRIGREMACKDNRSFSNFIDWLIKEEAKKRGMIV